MHKHKMKMPDDTFNYHLAYWHIGISSRSQPEKVVFRKAKRSGSSKQALKSEHCKAPIIDKDVLLLRPNSEGSLQRRGLVSVVGRTDAFVPFV